MIRPWAAVDYDALMRAYPPPPEYFDSAWLVTPDEIERVQLERLQARAVAAERVPFFARRWSEAGFAPTELRTLDDHRREVEPASGEHLRKGNP